MWKQQRVRKCFKLSLPLSPVEFSFLWVDSCDVFFSKGLRFWVHPIDSLVARIMLKNITLFNSHQSYAIEQSVKVGTLSRRRSRSWESKTFEKTETLASESGVRLGVAKKIKTRIAVESSSRKKLNISILFLFLTSKLYKVFN